MLNCWIFALGILSLSVITALLPQLMKKNTRIQKYYPFITALTAGFLFSVLLLEFIPHLFVTHSCSKADNSAHSHHEKVNPNHGLVSGGIAFIALIAIDTLIMGHSNCTSNHGHDEGMGTCNISAIKDAGTATSALILLFALSIHSFFEGLSIDANLSKVSMGIKLGIVIHKALESIALGFELAKSKFKGFKLIGLIFFYGMLTPVGILLPKNGGLFKQYCDGLAFGSTLFIVCVEMIPSLLHKKKKLIENTILIGCMGFGFGLTSCLLIKFPHDHGP